MIQYIAYKDVEGNDISRSYMLESKPDVSGVTSNVYFTDEANQLGESYVVKAFRTPGVPRDELERACSHEFNKLRAVDGLVYGGEEYAPRAISRGAVTEDDGTTSPAYMMSRIEQCKSLADVLSGILSDSDAFQLAKMLVSPLRALKVCPSGVNGVVHGDLHPGNVLLVKGEKGKYVIDRERYSKAVLIDFGLARGFNDSVSRTDLLDNDHHQIALGAAAFNAPETLTFYANYGDDGKVKIGSGHHANETSSANVWSYGMLILKAMTGETLNCDEVSAALSMPHQTADEIRKRCNAICSALVKGEPERGSWDERFLKNPIFVTTGEKAVLKAICDLCLRENHEERPTPDNIDTALNAPYEFKGDAGPVYERVIKSIPSQVKTAPGDATDAVGQEWMRNPNDPSVQRVQALIDWASANDRESVELARKEYSKLSETQQDAVGNLGKLKELERQIAQDEESRAVKQLIENLPDKTRISAADHEALLSATASTANLTPRQKNNIGDGLIAKLESLWMQVEEDGNRAAMVDSAYQRLSEESALDEVDDVVASWKSLTSQQKSYVENRKGIEDLIAYHSELQKYESIVQGILRSYEKRIELAESTMRRTEEPVATSAEKLMADNQISTDSRTFPDSETKASERSDMCIIDTTEPNKLDVDASAESSQRARLQESAPTQHTVKSEYEELRESVLLAMQSDDPRIRAKAQWVLKELEEVERNSVFSRAYTAPETLASAADDNSDGLKKRVLLANSGQDVGSGRAGRLPGNQNSKAHTSLPFKVFACIGGIAIIIVLVVISGYPGFYDSETSLSQRVQSPQSAMRTEFADSSSADIGDTIEFQFKYVNKRGVLGGIWKTLNGQDPSNSLKLGQEDDVMIRFVLPDNLEYIEGSTVLYNSNYQDGVALKDDTATTTGINIGSYSIDGNTYVRITCKVVDNSLVPGTNELVTNASATLHDNFFGTVVLKDDSTTVVEK